VAKRPKATTAETAERVDEICRMMTAGEWIRGRSEDVLAKEWDLSASRVRELSAESWRRVCHEADSPAKARPNIVGTLLVALERALTAGKYGDVAKIADVWTRIIGAREPEKQEINLTEDQARAKYRELTGKEWGT
jgi:hypothetical protein